MCAPLDLSTSMPIVMRDGNAWGLMMMSGVMPLSVNGISCAGYRILITPFCPAREANLSPMTGLRLKRSLMPTFCSASSPASPSTRTSSTTQSSSSLCTVTRTLRSVSSTTAYSASPLFSLAPTLGRPSTSNDGSANTTPPGPRATSRGGRPGRGVGS